MQENNNEIKLTQLFISFLKIGLFTFGGGYAMIPLIEQEVVTKQRWIMRDEFIDLLTLAQSVPGPIALNSAAFVGYKSRGYIGAISAIMGIIVPSFVIIIAVALFFTAIRHNEVVEAAFKAMRPVVVALIVAPTIHLMKGMNWLSVVVMVASLALIVIFELSPVYFIFGSIVVALLWTRALKNKSNAKLFINARNKIQR